MTDPAVTPESPDEVDEAVDEAVDEPDGGRSRRDVTESDWLDQTREVTPGERRGPITRGPDAAEADAIEQATEVPIDDDRVE